MNNNKEKKDFVMPNGFKITGNINYYTKRKLEGIAAELEEIPHEGHSVGGNKNRYGAVWVHFAVRPKDNRRKVAFLNA
jgi:hypothetical protein